MKIKTAENIFVLGILWDLFTTSLGLTRGLVEGHPAGEHGVFMANFIFLGVFIVAHEKVREHKFKHFFKYSYATVGLLRALVGVWNLYLIIRYT